MKSMNSECAEVPDFVTLETGSLLVNADDAEDWHIVSLRSNYESPVILLEITTYNGGQPVHPRI